jgi:hypothetical protein
MNMGEFPMKIDQSNSSFRAKRELPRFAFIAKVEVTELSTGAHMSGRISEISRKGCFIDILKTLMVGTIINIVISRDQESFTTVGAVIYTQEGTGMGVAFQQSEPEQLAILDAWLGASTSLCFFTPDENIATK